MNNRYHHSLNIHIYPSPFKNESRIQKQATYLDSLGIFDKILLVGTREKDLPRKELLSNKTEILRLGHENKRGGLIIKSVRFIYWYISILIYFLNKKVTCVNVHSLSSLPIGYLLSRLKRAYLIYDTHELETETNGTHGIRKILAKLVEKSLIPHVDHVFVVSENIANWYQDTYQIKRPTVLLNVPEITPLQKSTIFRDRFRLQKHQLVLLYQGALNHGRGIHLLLTAFMERKSNDVVILFMGYGALENEIIKFSEKCNSIFFHEAVSPDQLLKHTMSADVGISFIENTCLSYYYCMPNKLFEYAMAGLPVITSNMKEMKETVKKHAMGIVIEESTPQSINKAIDQLLTIDLSQMKYNARKAAEENSWEFQAEKMSAIYKTIEWR